MQEKRDSSARSALRNDKNLSFSAACLSRQSRATARAELKLGSPKGLGAEIPTAPIAARALRSEAVGCMVADSPEVKIEIPA